MQNPEVEQALDHFERTNQTNHVMFFLSVAGLIIVGGFLVFSYYRFVDMAGQLNRQSENLTRQSAQLQDLKRELKVSLAQSEANTRGLAAMQKVLGDLQNSMDGTGDAIRSNQAYVVQRSLKGDALTLVEESIRSRAVRDLTTGSGTAAASRPANATAPSSTPRQSTSPADRLAEMLAAASQALDDNDTDAALDLFTQVSREDPANMLAWWGIGKTRVIERDYDPATQALNRALSLAQTDQDRAGILAEQGRVHMRLGEWAQADAVLSQVIDIDPQYGTAYRRRGLANMKLGELDEAEADFERAAKLATSQADYASATENSGLLFINQGRWEEAYEHALFVSELDPGASWNAFILLVAMTQLELKDQQGALQDWENAKFRGGLSIEYYLSEQLREQYAYLLQD